MESLVIICGLTAGQMILAVYTVFLKRVLAQGFDLLFLITIMSFAASLFFLPFAVALEKNKWPKRLKSTLLIKIGLNGLAGPAYQLLLLEGLKKTSPAIASAMPNLVPGLTFIIATSLRFEKFDIRSKYSRAKAVGTLVCLGGAIALSFLQTTPSALSPILNEPLHDTSYRDWLIGCFYLIVAIIVLACSLVLQAAIMVYFPAPSSLFVIVCLMTSTIMPLVQVITEGKLTTGSSISITSIIAISLGGGPLSNAPILFQTWCIEKRGPVMASIFSPIQTVFSAILSAIILRQFLSLGSLAGMLLMFVGLYIFLWAKHKEDCNQLLPNDSMDQPIQDPEEPLLS